jgi:hypothetical protein
MGESDKPVLRRLRLLALTAGAAVALTAAAVGRAQQAPAAPTPAEWQTALKAVREVAFDPAQSVQRRANAVTAYAKLRSLRGEYDDAVKTCWEALKVARTVEVAEAAGRAASLASRWRFGHVGGAAQLVDSWIAKAPGGPSRGALSKIKRDFVKIRQYVMGIAAKKMPPPPIRMALARWAMMQPKSGVAALNFRMAQVAKPPWVVVQKGRGPSALQVSVPKLPPSPVLVRDAKTQIPRTLNLTLPVYAPPPWYVARDGRTRIPQALKLTLPVYTAPSWYKRVQFPLLKEPKK